MGLIQSLISQSFPPTSEFTVNDIPDLTGKVVIVTGANTGVGKETARALLAHGAKVYIAGRNKQKCEAAIKELQDETGNEAIFLQMDLADLRSVKSAAEEFQSKEKELHILFNNAGLANTEMDEITAQGYDLQFGVNVLGHFYFTKLLIPKLLAGVATSKDQTVRVVNTASLMHHFFSRLDFHSFKDGPARRKLNSVNLYAQSKFGNIVFAKELARRYGNQGIISTSLHPGSLNSELHRTLSSWQRAIMTKICYEPSYGALTQLWAGTSQEGAEFNGKYLIPWARMGEAEKAADDPDLGKELWTWMEEQVKDI